MRLIGVEKITTHSMSWYGSGTCTRCGETGNPYSGNLNSKCVRKAEPVEANSV